MLPQCIQDNKRGGFPPWGKPGNGTWWFPCGVASSPESLQLKVSTGETPSETAVVSPVPLCEWALNWNGISAGSYLWNMGAVQQSDMPVEHSHCLRSQCNFQCHKFLHLQILAGCGHFGNNSQSCLMRAVFLSFDGNHWVLPGIQAQQGNPSEALFAPHSAL